MPSKRTGFAPWSLTREAGVLSATVDGTVEVPQNVQPTLSTGFVDYKGNWQGAKSSDETFIGFTKHLVVANGGTVLVPATGDVDHIDMTGFNNIFIAIIPSNGGNFAIEAVMGPDTSSFANLSPVNAASVLRVSLPSRVGDDSFEKALSDGAEVLTTNVWNIFQIQTRLAEQKLLQFKLTNNSGAESDVEFAFMRTV